METAIDVSFRKIINVITIVRYLGGMQDARSKLVDSLLLPKGE